MVGHFREFKTTPPYYYGRSISWCTTKFKDDLPIRPSLVIVSQFLLAG
ncbi:hypothetical protein F441_08093 [Phytophthora nicotianae CJ01A1]|uniref:Uncharacterized protein n=1 Tax=Phytophthora nicotianae CJ01A1 TaxID=1317063 RepID=W2X6G0_PHYNI|nr:hypothetical protein F441_08093 [Phytophthora nicotianae CJ01A1]